MAVVISPQLREDVLKRAKEKEKHLRPLLTLMYITHAKKAGKTITIFQANKLVNKLFS